MGDRLITYETIYECLRNEKSRDALQKLDSAFFEDVQNYLAEKEQIHADAHAKDDVFSVKETDKIAQQLRNVRSILADLYTRRERKVIDLAINLVRTRSAVVDTSNIHVHERQFFDAVVGVLEQYRASTMKMLLTARKGAPAPVPAGMVAPIAPSASRTITADAPAGPAQKNGQNADKTGNGTQVEFLSAVDAFIDAQLNEFGPFSSNDRAVIPSEIAHILITEGKAREV